MANFLGSTLQGVMNPQGINIQPDIAQLLQAERMGQALDREKQANQQQKTLRDAGASAVAIRSQPPELRKQAMAAMASQFQQAGNQQGAEAMGRLMQLDNVGLEAALDDLIFKASGKMPTAGGSRSTATLKPGENLVDAATGEVIASGAADTANADKNQADIRKEVRGRVGADLKDISKQAAVIKQNYSKVQNLAKQVEKGNRISASQALTALVKLGDPGSVVSGNEVNAALNAQNPIAAMTEMLSSKGVSGDVVSSIAQRIDPLNPKNINTDDLLATANALVGANVPALQSRFSENESLAGDNLTDAGVKSLFPTGLSNRIAKLTSLTGERPAQASAINQAQPVPTTATNPQTGERLVLRNGQWQPM